MPSQAGLPAPCPHCPLSTKVTFQVLPEVCALETSAIGQCAGGTFTLLCFECTRACPGQPCHSSPKEPLG